jgi:hypothetical protein
LAVPVVDDGLFRLPLFLRAGAIVPRMAVDEQTMNLAGLRRDGSVRDELIVQIVPAPETTNFTLYEDDGRTTAYQSGAVRTTRLGQQWTGTDIIVSIEAASGEYEGAVTERNNVIEVALNGEPIRDVLLDGESLPPLTSQAAFEAADRGWYQGETAVYAKSGIQPVNTTKEFTVQLAGLPEIAPVPDGGTAVPAAPPVETPTDSNLSGSLVWGIFIVVLVLLAGAVFWWRRKNTGAR